MFIAAFVRVEIFESSNSATQPNLGKRYQMRKDELSEFENAYTESIKEPESVMLSSKGAESIQSK